MVKKILLFLLILVLVLGGTYYFASAYSFALREDYDPNYGDSPSEMAEILSRLFVIYSSVNDEDSPKEYFNKDLSFLPWGKVVPFYRDGAWNVKFRDFKVKIDENVYSYLTSPFMPFNLPERYKVNDTINVSGKIYPKSQIVDLNIDGDRVKIEYKPEQGYISFNDNIYDSDTLVYKIITNL